MLITILASARAIVAGLTERIQITLADRLSQMYTELVSEDMILQRPKESLLRAPS